MVTPGTTAIALRAALDSQGRVLAELPGEVRKDAAVASKDSDPVSGRAAVGNALDNRAHRAPRARQDRPTVAP
jgi:hypothetical protein